MNAFRIDERAISVGSGPVDLGGLKTSRPIIEELDREYALDLLGGDEELFREILGLFLDDAPKLLSEMARAMERSDGLGLRRMAHTMAGVAGNFGLPIVVEAARIIENETSDGPSPRALEAFMVLREILEGVLNSPLDAHRACP